jgi:ABC-type multidrug transport system fused ATPase/permease subunit
MEKANNNTPIFRLLVIFWGHVTHSRKIELSILLILMFIAGFAEAISIGAIFPFLAVLVAPEKIFNSTIVLPLVQLLNLTTPNQLLLPLTIAFGFCAVLAALMRLCLTWAQIRLSYSLAADLSVKIYERTLYQPYAVHISRNSSEIISGITTKVDIVGGSFISPVLNIITSLVMLIIIFSALIIINPQTALISSLGFGLIYFSVAIFARKQLYVDGQKINHEHTKTLKALQEGLGGIRDVLIDGSQLVYVAQYKKAEVSLRRSLANVQIVSASPRFIVEMLGMLLISSLAFYITYSGQGVESALPSLGALALGAQRLLPILQQIYYSWSSLRGAQATVTEVLNLIEQPLPKNISDNVMHFEKKIIFSDINFSYSSQAPLILNNLTLSIPKGSRIGIIGSTGSGKTTFLDIVMGLLSPTSGQIYLDSKEVILQNYRPWQERIAHVPQTIFLSDASILENIAFGVPKELINLARVKEASKIAQIESTIEAWPNKYETRVGERGVQLSGGQRQRIGIARAMYKNADIIIFDEATSALDNETENLVIQAIERLPRHLTVLVVAHRLATLRNCSLIVEFVNGRVKRSGSFAEIIGI